ncbi:flagellar biosynthesis protein FlhF [Sporosarcina sp. OR05]|uniref:flagellar biosynthesis protein FlhF n=1 Tax=Sporosarcina sp. OR05 TaxID=2969819 RepID=UPI00352B3A76
MKMKKYTADTMVEAMKKVRSDFGDDAVILSSNVVKTTGFLGLFKRKMVEVVAGFDEPPQSKIQKTTLFEKEAAQISPIESDLKKEMHDMKKLLQEMKQATSFANFPDSLSPLLTTLEAQGLSKETIYHIGNLLFTTMKEDKKDLTTVEQKQKAAAVLAELFADLPFGGIDTTKKYINVLGPTGVGKTTTIAKIAARALLENKKKVGFITTDTYRIAAIEQLRTYANLLQAPVEIAYNREDFKVAIDKLKDVDLVFIDTAGRNYKETKYVEDVKQLIDFSLDMETFLVLSVTAKEDDMKAVVEKFTSFPIEKFIFTKVDETSSIGPMFNLMKQFQIGAAYFTDGQEVPEDLTEATVKLLIDRLLAGVDDA